MRNAPGADMAYLDLIDGYFVASLAIGVPTKASPAQSCN